MSVNADGIICRARALIGTHFRLHGRDSETGLDCVGLCACVAEVMQHLPTGYPLRGGDAKGYASQIDGFAQRHDQAPQPADVVLIRVSSVQFHMGIWTGESLIHAHAGLGRVVETPGAPGGDILGCWTVMGGPV